MWNNSFYQRVHRGFMFKVVKALNFCRELGIDKVLLTCIKDNVASSKTIISNGGILEKEVEDNGSILQRYWINL